MGKRIISIVLMAVVVLCVPLNSMAAEESEIRSAYSLYKLGLLKGTGTNLDGTPVFDLDSPVSRLQAVTMLVRLLGKEDAAKAVESECPFEDVPDWALPYVGYAYEKELTFGIDEKTFGSYLEVTADQYVTFVLRILGYDSSFDFDWNNPWDLSDNIRLTNGEYGNDSVFLRSDVVNITTNALSACMKNTETCLLARLYSEGAVSGRSIAETGLIRLLGQQTLNATQISAMASPAVFFLEVYKSEAGYASGIYSATGSGFFISKDGVAVTNYHVIEGTSVAYITMTDGMKYKVSHVIYADEERDIVVLRVSMVSETGEKTQEFPYLKIASSDTINDGDTVYAIGSPLGLQNTITDGIVGNKNRYMIGDKLPYIQISAAISSGSSGGALLNAYGDVIGVTTATIGFGQNINLAIPLDSIQELDLMADGIPYQQVYENYRAEIKMKSNGYEQYNMVPDFGDFFNAPVYYLDNTDKAVFYFYDFNNIFAFGSYQKVFNVYNTLLDAWDFQMSGYFFDDSFIIWVYNNGEGLELCFGPSYLDNSLMICVMIIK